MIFLVAFVVFPAHTTHADSHEEQTDAIIPAINDDEQTPASENIWVPQKMIKGHQSYGMVILDKTSNNNRIVILGTSNSDIADVEKNTVILAHQNHGIFEIVPKSQGDVTISAVHGGNQFDAATTVYSDAKKPSMLEIIVPGEKIKADKIDAVVYSLDDNGSSVAVDHNTRVKISSSENIKTPMDVMIPFGEDHAFFPITVNGNGFVSASSNGFEPSRVDLTKTLEDVNINFNVAPNIAHKNSLVYFYLQLEKDGKPYRPPYVVDAFLTSSNEGIVSFSKEGRTDYENNRVFSVSLVDGFAKGVAYTKGEGSAQLLANVPAFGFARSDLVVGKAVFNADVNQTPQAVITQNNASAGIATFEKSQYEDPTDLLMWVFPNPTDKDAYAVVGTYRIEIEKEIVLELAEDQTQESVIFDQFTITPVLLDDGILAMSSSGNVNHGNAHILQQNSEVPISAIEIPLEGFGDGTHQVFASSTNLKSTNSEVVIVSQYDEEYGFQIKMLPFSIGDDDASSRDDVAMVSIVDGTQSIIDVSTISEDGSLGLFVSSPNPFADTQEVQMYKNMHVITAEQIFEKEIITVASDRISPQTIEIMPSGVTISAELDIPARVHVDEIFPYVVYDVDSNKVPLKENNTFDLSASNKIQFVDRSFLKPLAASDDESVIVMTDHGISSQSIEIFENRLFFVSEIDSTSVRVNDKVLIRIISDVAGIDFKIESPFPNKQLDDSTFVIMPDKELNTNITIIGTKNGYSAYSETIPLDAKKIVTVDVKGLTNDGGSLSIPYRIHSQGTSDPYTAPYTHDLKTVDSVLEFPERHTTSFGYGYEFQNMVVNGDVIDSPKLETKLDEDLMITLNYQRQVYIDVVGTDGSGVYEYGETVNLEAPDIPKAWYFVKDTFDHWEGIEDKVDSSISFEATQDMQITAVYREDNSLWMVIVLTSSVAMMAFGLYKKNESVRWMVNEQTEKILKLLSSKKIKKSEKESTSDAP